MASQDYPVKDADGVTIIPSGRGEGPRASVDISALAVTWNNGATTFNGILLDVTDTASAAASNLMNLRKDGVSRFAVSKNGPLTIASATVTVSQPILDLSQTWNAGGVTFTGFKVNITDTASNAASLLQDWQVGDVSQARIGKGGTLTSLGSLLSTGGNVGVISDSGRFLMGASSDVQFYRDAANTSAQRNGTNAQAFRIYNTFTDGSNYERAFFQWTTNLLEIGTQAAGTGTKRSLALYGNDITLNYGTGGSVAWRVSTSGHLLAGTDNSFDIGASGANRPRHAYIGSNLLVGGLSAFAVAVDTATIMNIGAGQAARSSMRINIGVAPTSPVNGDIWFDGTDLKMRVGGVTKTFTLT